MRTHLPNPFTPSRPPAPRTPFATPHHYWQPHSWLLGLLLLNGCQSAEDAFTDGRIEQLCDRSVPVCNSQASCVLSTDQYLEGAFPGGLKIIVRTETDEATLIVRTLLTDPRFPGTEYQVAAYDTGCSVPEEVLIQDQDLFDLAGDDGVIEHHLQVTGRGDHLVELFSDMSASFLFRVDVDE